MQEEFFLGGVLITMLVITIILLPFRLVYWKHNLKFLFFSISIALIFGGLFTLPYIFYHWIIQYHLMQDIYEEAFRVGLLSLFVGVFVGVLLPCMLVRACPCPPSVRSPENEDSGAEVVQEVSSEPEPPVSAPDFGEKSEKEQN